MSALRPKSAYARIKLWLALLFLAASVGGVLQALDPGRDGRAPPMRCLETAERDSRAAILAVWQMYGLTDRARWMLWLDCLFPLVYAPLIASACLWGAGTALRRGSDDTIPLCLMSGVWVGVGVVLAGAQVAAGCADLKENLSLLAMIEHRASPASLAGAVAATTWKWRLVKAGSAFIAASVAVWSLGPAAAILRAASARRGARA